MSWAERQVFQDFFLQFIYIVLFTTFSRYFLAIFNAQIWRENDCKVTWKVQLITDEYLLAYCVQI